MSHIGRLMRLSVNVEYALRNARQLERLSADEELTRRLWAEARDEETVWIFDEPHSPFDTCTFSLEEPGLVKDTSMAGGGGRLPLKADAPARCASTAVRISAKRPSERVSIIALAGPIGPGPWTTTSSFSGMVGCVM